MKISSRSVQILWGLIGSLFLTFLVGLGLLWRVLPDEGVKLHGNVNTGVDLLGSRNDLLWIAVLGSSIISVNGVLAWLAFSRDRAASLFLLSTSVAVMFLMLGVVIFLAVLNRIL